jgi:hypothetical protein
VTGQLRRAEERLAARYTPLLEAFGRLAGAMRAGSWHYAWEQARDVHRLADRLAEAFTEPGRADSGQQVIGYRDPDADPARVHAAVTAEGGHLALVAAVAAVSYLHPAPGEAE